MADAHALGACLRKKVEVRLLSRAQKKIGKIVPQALP